MAADARYQTWAVLFGLAPASFDRFVSKPAP
jgi:hypothetical protein